MTQKYKCRCRKEVDELTSYFHKVNGMRITVCDECAEKLKLNTGYGKKYYSELTKTEKNTPFINATIV